MVKKVFAVFSLLMIFVLAACAAQPTLEILPPVADSAQTPVPNGAPASANGQANGNNTLENRLAYGILKLEGTTNAVTAAQAKVMLPLWQQIKTMTTSLIANTGSDNSANSTTTGDMQAVYTQIEQALNADQIQAIQQASMTQSDIQAMMQQYNIQTTPGSGFNGGNFPTLSPEERAARAAQFQQTPGVGGGRGSGRTGTPGANGFGGFGGNGTPGANGGRGGFRGMNFIFVDPLINLLQQRAGS